MATKTQAPPEIQDDVEIAVDMSGVKVEKNALLPLGTYRWAIKDVLQPHKAEESGNVTGGILCEITDVIGLKKNNEVSAPEGGVVGRTAFYNYTISPKTTGYFKGFCLAVGYAPEVVDSPNFRLRKSDVLGKEFVGDLTHKQNRDGVKQNSISPFGIRALTEKELSKI